MMKPFRKMFKKLVNKNAKGYNEIFQMKPLNKNFGKHNKDPVPMDIQPVNKFDLKNYFRIFTYTGLNHLIAQMPFEKCHETKLNLNSKRWNGKNAFLLFCFVSRLSLILSIRLNIKVSSRCCHEVVAKVKVFQYLKKTESLVSFRIVSFGLKTLLPINISAASASESWVKRCGRRKR